MSLYEFGLSSGAVSLSALLSGEDFAPCACEMSPEALIESACIGGWPVNRGLDVASALEVSAEYLNRVLSEEIPHAGRAVRQVPKFRLLLAALARSNASIVKNSTLLANVRSAADDFSETTLSNYLQALRDLFILEEIPGWQPRISSKTRIISSPKRMFTDPSLAVAALGATPAILSADLQAFGSIFEGLCLRDLLIYAAANSAGVFHYRDNSKLEVDAIVETRDGSWAAFEVKLSPKKCGEGAKSLLALRDKMVSQGANPPICLTVLTGAGVAGRREDGVYVVPIQTLRP
jgi:predicted AAA+ superfamily ATPase